MPLRITADRPAVEYLAALGAKRRSEAASYVVELVPDGLPVSSALGALAAIGAAEVARDLQVPYGATAEQLTERLWRSGMPPARATELVGDLAARREVAEDQLREVDVAEQLGALLANYGRCDVAPLHPEPDAVDPDAEAEAARIRAKNKQAALNRKLGRPEPLTEAQHHLDVMSRGGHVPTNGEYQAAKAAREAEIRAWDARKNPGPQDVPTPPKANDPNGNLHAWHADRPGGGTRWLEGGEQPSPVVAAGLAEPPPEVEGNVFDREHASRVAPAPLTP